MSWKMQFRDVVLSLVGIGVAAVPTVIEVVGYGNPVVADPVANPAVPGGLVGAYSPQYNIPATTPGVTYTLETITSLSKATQQLSSLVHRWASLGKDPVGVCLGMPINSAGLVYGPDPAGTLAPMTALAAAEQQYVHLDIPSRDLKHAISQANKTATAANGVVYGQDYGSDLANIVMQ